MRANDSRPDVNCAGLGGLSGLRSHGRHINVGFCDGSVRRLSTDINLQTWHYLTQRNDGQGIQDLE